MFDKSQIEKIMDEYFNIIMIDKCDITVQSRNTGHYWYLHCPEYPLKSSCVIFHKHRYSQPYHKHKIVNSLCQAVQSIKSHDKWQLNGRKR